MVKVTKLHVGEWADFVADCPGATFFHTPEWYKVWEAYDNYRCEAHLLHFESGRKALLPLASKPMLKGLARAYHSSPAGTYGGFLSKDQLDNEDKKELHQYVRSFSTLLLQEAPFTSTIINKAFFTPNFTQFIDLSEGLLINNWSNNHKRSLKKGLATNYFFQAGDTLDNWKEYFEVYKDSLERWGEKASDQYDWTFFELLHKLPKERCRLWFIKQQDRMTAGCICFYFNNHVIYWHGAALSDYFQYKPVHLLHYHIIEDAIHKNHRYYDFNPSGGHEGVVQFKKGFGTKSKPIKYLEWRSGSIQFIYKLFGIPS